MGGYSYSLLLDWLCMKSHVNCKTEQLLVKRDADTIKPDHRGAAMYIMGTTDYPLTRPEEMKGSLWHCDECDSFVTIHRLGVVHQAMCPTCADVVLEYCGSFDSILGRGFVDA